MLRSLALAALVLAGCSSREDRVTVYCAQDKEFAEALLAEASDSLHQRIETRYDTEASKSVGLFEDLKREAARPRCGVWWNNEILNTIRMRRLGLLEPYASPSAVDYPSWTRPGDRTYQAFAARARVLIVHDRVAPADRPTSLLDLTQARFRGRVCLARPVFGTSATQAVCLAEVMGIEAAKTWYAEMKANGAAVVAGNRQVARLVATGAADIGITDSDDAMQEMNDRQPVSMIFPDRAANATYPRFGTLYIPNTLALIRNGPNPAGSKELIDTLLRAETETRLAEGGGYQIPLNPKVQAELPAGFVRPEAGRAMAVDFEKAADLWDAVQEYLRGY